MSWTRTAIALIGFGFTIVQFFERLRSTEGVAPPANAPAARYLGMTLILAGTIGLAIGVWEYTAFIRYLWRTEFKSIAGVSETPATPRSSPYRWWSSRSASPRSAQCCYAFPRAGS